MALVGALAFACSACGRTDLPSAGAWDPPICAECDAAINFDLELELEQEQQVQEEMDAEMDEDL